MRREASPPFVPRCRSNHGDERRQDIYEHREWEVQRFTNFTYRWVSHSSSDPLRVYAWPQPMLSSRLIDFKELTVSRGVSFAACGLESPSISLNPLRTFSRISQILMTKPND